MKAFKAYDIRGLWNSEINAEIAYKIGYFIPKVFDVNKILVGRDIRLSSDGFFCALTDGMTDAGADVYDAGLTTTPMVYWGTGKFNFEASVMITASHNSSGYNGLKFSAKNVQPIGYDNGLNILESLVESNTPVIKKSKGYISKFDYIDDYVKFLNKYKQDYSELKISIDCSNGMAALFAKELFGIKPDYINEVMDGSFPGHEPNPLAPENQQQIKNIVKKNCSDVGVIFDGDADRVMFIDENGMFISPDLIIALLGHYFFEERNEKGKVVQDIRTSKAVGEYLKRFNAELVIWKVGRAFAATRLKEVDGVYGGELAGHYYFRDFYYSDSGLMAALIVLNIIKKFKTRGITFSGLISRISSYANTGEVNFVVAEKQKAMDEVLAYFKNNEPPVEFFDFDGYRLEFNDWWFNIRPSNTEPFLRFLAEAKSEEMLSEKTALVYKILEKYS
ncbi:MAG: phosphomannomutase/phosphoglucomutase [Bacteroidetes bacterium]|nr:phosphomannomutase/phosphoglucomutase [Bacteroidota bacterium]MBL6943644.1 phosphomannomutase/phosphoglucomutase [Bacteroidales bacterium]